MTDIAIGPDLAAIKQRQQATWASGDYHMIGTQILLSSELLIESLDVHSTERVLDVATGSGNAALAAARRGCTVIGIDYVPALLDRARQRAAAEGRRRRVHRGRRRGAPVRGRQLRRRHLGLRRDVRAGPGADRARARTRLPARRADRARRAHAGRVHRQPVQGDRPPRPAAGGPPLADPVGHRGTPARAVRRSASPRSASRSATSSSATRRRRPTSSTGAATTVRRSRRSRPSARPAGTGSRETCSTSSRASTAPTTARWSSRASTSRRSSSRTEASAGCDRLPPGRRSSRSVSPETELRGDPGRLRPRRGPELAQDVRDVDARRVLADEQLLGDLAVGPALDQERQDVALAAGQAERILRASRSRWTPRHRASTVRSMRDLVASASTDAASGRAPRSVAIRCASTSAVAAAARSPSPSSASAWRHKL